MLHHKNRGTAVPWVTKVGGQDFLTDSCKFPTEEIMGTENFNFGPKFPQNRDFQPQPKGCFFEENFPTA